MIWKDSQGILSEKHKLQNIICSNDHSFKTKMDLWTHGLCMQRASLESLHQNNSLSLSRWD